MFKALLSAALLLAGLAPQALAEPPADYGPLYAATLSDAVEEGIVRIDTTTDTEEAADLLKGFHALYPAIKIDYHKWNSGQLYDSVAAGAGADAAGSDMVWSSAMDLQIKLINDGYAQSYVSPEAQYLPPWAIWRYEGYGTTAEPVAIVYNRQLLPDADVPRSHAELTRLLTAKSHAFQGRIATYDPELSGAGYLFIAQDLEITPRTWDLVRALGRSGVQLYTTTSDMLDAVSSGRQLIAYNIIASYASERARQDPSLEVVLPSDYTIMVSRIAFIPKASPHPNAARLFLDYLLSRKGQTELSFRLLGTIRDDAENGTAPAIPPALKPALRPITIGPELLADLDQARRARFLGKWQAALQGR